MTTAMCGANIFTTQNNYTYEVLSLSVEISRNRLYTKGLRVGLGTRRRGEYV